ncbi:MAG TPA: BTAD domain-containing putative transcriptional regulator, partial [Pseudonocardiaceae bacterium]|nr:BTAD domain-containing putative transcriptional regulator [Pseudonocardiaceae bacterium]
MTLEFRVLGPLAVRRDDEPVPVNSARQRALLGALLVDANRVVTTQDLAYRVWGDGTPPGARETLQSYVMRLRRTLGQGSEGSPVVTRPDGYLIEVADGALDLDRFETLVRQAKAAEDDPAARAKLLRDALAEWRGDALSDVPSDALHREVVPALREQRLAAVELRIDADLHLGQHQDVIAELTDLTARYPLLERFWAHRMLALYRSGRAAEALGCYESARKILADELGVDPGPELRELHAALLANDPALSTPDTTRKPKGRDDLPGDIPDFAGRADAVRRLVDLGRDATTVVISAIDGMAGVGKTTLAVHAAHQLAHRFPDGRLFIDLRGYTREGEPTEPAAALDVLLRAMDVPAGRIPADPDERSALWRAELAGRRVLVVLDNASSASQVRPLLPGSATCLALITSRHRLADLDTADTLSLDVLSPDEAFALFAGVIGADRAQADPAATADVLRLCGYLPLAIRI